MLIICKKNVHDAKMKILLMQIKGRMEDSLWYKEAILCYRNKITHLLNIVLLRMPMPLNIKMHGFRKKEL